MAPESIQRRIYSEKSDVYAFGILLWEMWSGGEIPFSNIPSDEDVIARVRGGLRLPKPSSCPSEVYNIMEHCWEQQSSDRPTFSQLKMDIQDALSAAQRAHEAPEESLCVICMDKQADFALFPCGHKCVCQEDAVATKQRGQCPVCRSQVQEFRRIYI
jgi:serine/threonine protein kinase